MERRAELKYKIEEIRASLLEPAPEHGKIGHNRPPEPLQIEEETIREVAETVDREVEKSDPNVNAVVEATIKIGRILKPNRAKLVESLVVQLFNKLLDWIAGWFMKIFVG